MLFPPLRTGVNLGFQGQRRSECRSFFEIVSKLQRRFRPELKPPQYFRHGLIRLFSIVNGTGLRISVTVLFKMTLKWTD